MVRHHLWKHPQLFKKHKEQRWKRLWVSLKNIFSGPWTSVFSVQHPRWLVITSSPRSSPLTGSIRWWGSYCFHEQPLLPLFDEYHPTRCLQPSLSQIRVKYNLLTAAASVSQPGPCWQIMKSYSCSPPLCFSLLPREDIFCSWINNPGIIFGTYSQFHYEFMCFYFLGSSNRPPSVWPLIQQQL